MSVEKSEDQLRAEQEYSKLYESLGRIEEPLKYYGTREELERKQGERRERIMNMTMEQQQLYVKLVTKAEKSYKDIVLLQKKHERLEERNGKYDLESIIRKREYMERLDRRRELISSNERRTLREKYGKEYVRGLSDRYPTRADIELMREYEIYEVFTKNKLMEYCRERKIRGAQRFTKRGLVHHIKQNN